MGQAKKVWQKKPEPEKSTKVYMDEKMGYVDRWRTGLLCGSGLFFVGLALCVDCKTIVQAVHTPGV